MSRFWGRRAADDVDEEIAFHRDMRVQEYLARGMNAVEAETRTAQRLGDLAASREACLTISHRRARRTRRTDMRDALKQDLAFALRTLVRQPAWTAVAVVTLALGIGASTAVYSVVNALLLHPLPYPGADRMVMVMRQWGQGTSMTVSPEATSVAAWRAGAHSFTAIEAYRTDTRTLHAPDAEPVSVETAAILSTFPSFAGVRPTRGRGFSPDDERTGALPVTMLSEHAWRTRFHGDPAIIGRSVTVDETDYQIVGIMPDRLQLPRQSDTPDFWFPLSLASGSPLAIGRLREGVTLPQATAELDTVRARAGIAAGGFSVALMRPADLIGYASSLKMLALAVMLVLLIACANVAHLLLVRGASRERELAIRASLGAGRARLFRQLLTESLLLTTGAALIGLALGWGALRVIIAWRPPGLGELATARIDGAVVLAAVGLALLTGVMFGAMGLVQLARHSTQASLRTGSLSSSASRGQKRLRGVLLVTEMALSATLLVGATLLVRSIQHLQQTRLGIEADGLYSTSITFPRSVKGPGREAFMQAFMAGAARLPGVGGVALSVNAPPGIGIMLGTLDIEGRPPVTNPEPGAIFMNGVSPSYFRTTGMSLQGTTFTDSTVGGGQVVINEGMAHANWGDTSALGKRFRIGNDGPWMTVVGVVGNSASNGLMGDPARPILYTPREPSGEDGAPIQLVTRHAAGTDAVTLLRGLSRSLDPSLPPPQVTSVKQAMLGTIARPRFTTRLLMTFTVLALMLAAVGLYGVMAYTVAQRTREIGIRTALGASRRAVLITVLGNAMTLTAVGIGVGLAGSYWAAALLKGLLFGVERGDPVSLATGGLVLAGVSLLAGLLPARRALAVDPVVAIRAE